MVTELVKRIAALYPAAKFGPFGPVSVLSYKGVESIGVWDAALGPRPTDAQLLGADMLPAVKAARCAAIDDRTQALIAGGFTFDGATFSLSTAAQLNWTALFSARDVVPYPVQATTADDGKHSFPDPATVARFGVTAIGTVRALLDSGIALKVAVNAASNQAAIDAVVDAR